MDTNTRYLAKLWLVVGGVAGLLAIAAGAAFASGEAWLGILPITSIALTSALFVTIRWWVKRRLHRLLQADSPDPLVKYCERTIWQGLLPNGDAMLAQVRAMAYVLYGEYASARTALTRVAWNRCPPLIRASGTAVEALLCYFETREYIQGRNLAVAAQDLAAVPVSFPGARTSAAAYESYVEIGQVLCGQFTDATLASLERKMSALPTLGRLLVAWGLAVGHRQRGDAARAEPLLAYIREVAPHCRALALPDHAGETDPGAPANGGGK